MGVFLNPAIPQGSHPGLSTHLSPGPAVATVKGCQVRLSKVTTISSRKFLCQKKKKVPEKHMRQPHTEGKELRFIRCSALLCYFSDFSPMVEFSYLSTT